MKYAILSDVHANVTALKEVLSFINLKYHNEEVKFILLGDYINYGPRPNETIKILRSLNILSSINGNHENSILTGEVSRFSSKRGIDSLKYTSSIMNPDSMEFISSNKNGTQDIVIGNKKVLLVHGDLTDIFWGKMTRIEMEKDIYSPYDYVLSGHTHIPHLAEFFYTADIPGYRFKKKTIFINPGSVGQPRNHNSLAQFCLLDISLETFYFEKVSYNIDLEKSYYSDEFDTFYKDRLDTGI